MNKATLQLIAYVGAVLLAVAGVVCVFQPFNRDEVGFCRRVFGALTTGSRYIQESIDWEHFQALGADVGAEYQRLPNDEERAKFQESFIVKCAQGFRQEKGRLDDFVNWRLQQRGPMALVAADYPSKQKTLLFQVSTVGEKQLTAIQWQ